MGNHDAHYLSRTFLLSVGGSRYSSSHAEEIRQRLEAVNLRIAYEQEVNGKRILYSHAGVSEIWYEKYKELIGTLTPDHLNILPHSKIGWQALSDVGFVRGGEDIEGSPLWADIRETFDCPITNYGYDLQLIGHTQLSGDRPRVFPHIIDLDCHHPFMLTPEGQVRQY